MTACRIPAFSAALALLLAGAGAIRTTEGDIAEALAGEAGAAAGATNASSRGGVKVEVLFVRHGHACHNLMNGKYQGASRFAKIVHCRYPDPPLTDCGLRSSVENGRELRAKLDMYSWRPHLLGASSMVRAMETARAMFPDDGPVHSLPFISELGGGFVSPCNEPGSVARQKEVLGDPAGFSFDHVEWDGDLELQDPRVVKEAKKLMSRGHRAKWTSDEARSAVMYKEFRAFLGERVVPTLLDRAEVRGGDLVVRIAIVSHSGFLKTKIKKYFGCKAFFKKVYFQNNAAMLVHYDFDPASKQLTEGTSRNGLTCQLPLQLGGRPRAPRCTWGAKYGCSQDYQRCYAHGGDAYMGGGPSPPSPFVRPPPSAAATCCVSQVCPAASDMTSMEPRGWEEEELVEGEDDEESGDEDEDEAEGEDEEEEDEAH